MDGSDLWGGEEERMTVGVSGRADQREKEERESTWKGVGWVQILTT